MPRRGHRHRPYKLSGYALLRALRMAAAREQNGRCYWCNHLMTYTDPNDPHYCSADHLIPKHRGGKTVAGNIVAACRICNSSRHPELNLGPQGAGPRTYTIGDTTSHSPFEVLKK
jgi:5-methylcytosine-specific restriction endonuclease McrA